ncbi:MAG: hypothetical protein OXC68_14825 [Aestuariivita sp.]|nr:hypothetical protein [Aestuariivita sp.]
MFDNSFSQNDFLNVWVEPSCQPYQKRFKKTSSYKLSQNSTWAIPYHTFQSLRDIKKEFELIYNQLFKIKRAWDSAQNFLNEVDEEQTKQALYEAIALTLSQLFSEEIDPEICIDCYGEFTFSHKSRAGYVDIGVRGERELSYHVRNDINPEKTAFDDCEWDLVSLPKDLSIAMENLQQEIRGQFDPSK